MAIAPSQYMPQPHDPRLPLTPLTMAILLSLAEEDRHGYALMKSVEEQTGGNVKPGTGSLYAALQRLMDDEMIIESPRPLGEGEDPRRKSYRITEAGRCLVRAEAERMMRVLDLARDRSLAPTLGKAGGRA